MKTRYLSRVDHSGGPYRKYLHSPQCAAKLSKLNARQVAMEVLPAIHVLNEQLGRHCFGYFRNQYNHEEHSLNLKDSAMYAHPYGSSGRAGAASDSVVRGVCLPYSVS